MRLFATFTSSTVAVLGGLLSVTGFSGLASAAPQILAVASTDIPVPIHCEKGECSAELTAICLQEHRASPQTGQDYYLFDNKKLQLTLTNSLGQDVDISNLPLRLQTARGHTALKVSLKQSLLRDLDPAKLHVSVPRKLTAIPMPKANDNKPQTETDILIATGTLRVIAARLVDQNTGRADAARLINQAVNSLPTRGRSSPETRKAAQSYFTDVTEKSGYSENAVTLASKVVKQCFYETQVGFRSFRQCLGSSHDQLIGKLNTKYWHSLNSGS